MAERADGRIQEESQRVPEILNEPPVQFAAKDLQQRHAFHLGVDRRVLDPAADAGFELVDLSLIVLQPDTGALRLRLPIEQFVLPDGIEERTRLPGMHPQHTLQNFKKRAIGRELSAGAPEPDRPEYLV